MKSGAVLEKKKKPAARSHRDLSDIRQALPADVFRSSVGRSLSYFFLDLVIIAALFYAAYRIDSWFFWPFYFFAQGTMFWALFVVGHDCGHGSFSRYKTLNHFIGHLCHTPILVPYHGWRISHRTHHQNTGNIDRDETWYPITESQYAALDPVVKFLRYKLFLLVFPIYLFRRSPGRDGSHFLPGSDVFKPSEKKEVLTSSILWFAMFGLLIASGYVFGIAALAKYYIAPYLVCVVWLDLVTFLHHTDSSVPWYRGEDWDFTKGALSTVDRSYGIFEPIHHNIGTHIAHHLFTAIPHYKLKEATISLKEYLGNDYRKSDEPIFRALLRSWKECGVVADEGSPVFYKPVPRDIQH